MANAPRIVRAGDPVAAASALLAEAIAAADGRRGAARLAIPGGSALAALGPARARVGAAWERVRLTWVDERCVPFADAASNRGEAYRSGALDAAHPPAAELALFLDGERGAQSVARAQRALDEWFGGALDVLLLGMGEDGHVASLFPGWSAPHGARVAHVAASPKPPPERITLTRALLVTAGRAILLATGEDKRAALQRLASGDAALPASGLPGLVAVTDLALRGVA